MRDLFQHIRRLVQFRSIWLFFFLFKAIMSALLVIPFFLTTNGILSSSLFSKGLISDWDMSVIIELFFGRGDVIPVYLISILIGAIIYMVIMQFLNGGLYYLIVSGETAPVKWEIFFAECSVNFIVNIKISLLMLFIYMALLPAGVIFVNVLGLAGGNLVGKSVIAMMFFKLGILAVILLAASFFSDSIRATASASPEKSFGEIVKIGARYFRPRLLKLLGIFVLTFLPFLLVWGTVEWLAVQSVEIMTGMIGIILEFLLFQICSFTRTGQKLWYLLFFGRDFNSQNPGRFLPKQANLPFGN